MIFGPSGNVHEAHNTSYWTLDTPNYSKASKKMPKTTSRKMFGNIKIEKIGNVRKDACRKSLRSVLSILENLKHGINHFRKP